MNSIRPIDYELLKDEEIVDLILKGEVRTTDSQIQSPSLSNKYVDC